MRYQVRHHRPIVDTETGKVLFPACAIIDDLSKVPSAQHDKLFLLEDEPAAVAAPAEPVDEDSDDRGGF